MDIANESNAWTSARFATELVTGSAGRARTWRHRYSRAPWVCLHHHNASTRLAQRWISVAVVLASWSFGCGHTRHASKFNDPSGNAAEAESPSTPVEITLDSKRPGLPLRINREQDPTAPPPDQKRRPGQECVVPKTDPPPNAKYMVCQNPPCLFELERGCYRVEVAKGPNTFGGSRVVAVDTSSDVSVTPREDWERDFGAALGIVGTGAVLLGTGLMSSQCKEGDPDGACLASSGTFLVGVGMVIPGWIVFGKSFRPGVEVTGRPRLRPPHPSLARRAEVTSAARPSAVLKNPPVAALGFELGASAEDIEKACREAGNQWARAETEATCIGTLPDADPGALAKLTFCDERLCKVMLFETANEQTWRSTLFGHRKRLSEEYGEPSKSVAKIPEACRARILECLHTRQVQVAVTWAWADGHSIQLELRQGLDGDVQLVSTYAMPSKAPAGSD